MTQPNENSITIGLKVFAYPYLLDHHLDGRPIIPAMLLLQSIADAVYLHFPATDIFSMTEASFNKPLFFDPSCQSIDTLCTLGPLADGTIGATLSSLTKIESISATRTKDHASVRFLRHTPEVLEIPKIQFHAPQEQYRSISNVQLYSEIVRFGESFRSVRGEILLFKDTALAEIYAPPLPGSEGRTGSFFPLDGGMHTACAWAWTHQGIIAFPVGFKTRLILAPIRAGETVQCLVQPIMADEKSLTCNLWLYDTDHTIRELVLGLIMKEISSFTPTTPKTQS